MKTVVAVQPYEIALLDTPVPVPGPYQALVKTELACICNQTDSELLAGKFPGMEDAFPFALGHESVGIVVEVGAKVRNFKLGDRAVGGLGFELQKDGVDSGGGGFGGWVVPPWGGPWWRWVTGMVRAWVSSGAGGGVTGPPSISSVSNAIRPPPPLPPISITWCSSGSSGATSAIIAR